MTPHAHATLAGICRHPIKAVGREQVAEATLAPSAPLPMDRVWAVAHAAGPADADSLGRWAPKHGFLRGVAGPELMAISAESDAGTGRISLQHPRAGELSIDPEAEADRARLIAWLRPLWPAGRPAPVRLVRAPEGGALADTPEPHIALLSHASNRALEDVMGRSLSIHRWRGNFWIDGLAPWEEFDLIGREIAVGEARLRIERRITRCRATTVDPETGMRNADTLGALAATRGDQDFGVYAVVTRGGTIRPGDRVRP